MLVSETSSYGLTLESSDSNRKTECATPPVFARSFFPKGTNPVLVSLGCLNRIPQIGLNNRHVFSHSSRD